MTDKKDKSLQNKLRAHIHEMEQKLGSWDKMLISSILSEKNKRLEGKTILMAAQEANKTSYEFMRDILIEENGLVSTYVEHGFSLLNQEDKDRYLYLRSKALEEALQRE